MATTMPANKTNKIHARASRAACASGKKVRSRELLPAAERTERVATRWQKSQRWSMEGQFYWTSGSEQSSSATILVPMRKSVAERTAAQV
ncbi:MAG TPA: hypothetical protein VNL14_20870 [Candidatus Acidoferrales bacterium]|nr:hypothetical protein [Candidatus Acidoferrales bacterium]